MQDHVVESDFGGVAHAEGDHGKGVANKYQVHAGYGGKGGRGEVMGRQHGYGNVFAVKRLDCLHCHWFDTGWEEGWRGSGSM